MQRSRIMRGFWTIAAISLAVGLAMSAWYAPVEPTLGPAQKIMYVHVPAAVMTYVACFIVFVASVAQLWQRKMKWDDVAGAAGDVAVLFSSTALLTGMAWARDAWGHWWVWSPRLSFSFALWALYVGYLATRRFVRGSSRRALFAAVYGIVAFLDVPLVYLSVKLLPDIHPTAVPMTVEMRATLLFWFVPIGLFGGGQIWARAKLIARERERQERLDATTRTVRGFSAAGAPR